MNIIGYTISVVDLASVPSPNRFLYKYNYKNNIKKQIKLKSMRRPAPGIAKLSTFELSKKKFILKFLYKSIWYLSSTISVILMILMGFWIPYIIGCCNRYLDHFGFIVITSRFYQHTIFLFLMYCMVSENKYIYINCGKPFCTSSELRNDISSISTYLIFITEILTILTFIFYLFSCKYLRIGIIATERNPWLAVRVGDIRDAISLFKEQNNINIKSHEWRRNIFWKKFISSKYIIRNIHNISNPDITALYSLLKIEINGIYYWDIPLIKFIAFNAVRYNNIDIFKLFFHPKILSDNNNKSPLLNLYNCIDKQGNYLIHEAVKYSSIEILHILINIGNANIPVLNKLNETPLHLS